MGINGDSGARTEAAPDRTPRAPAPAPGPVETGPGSALTLGGPTADPVVAATVAVTSRETSPPDAETAPILTPGGGSPRVSPPRFLGEYELLEEIARGGMGIVYRARQVKLNRLVALKLVRDSALAGPSDLRRFRTEAEAVAQLDHPNIVPIYEVGQSEGQPYFSMKLIEGGNLSKHVEALKATPRVAVALMAKVARVVQYAHQRAILHRDIKPSNILVDKVGEPYVTDLGLAKRIDAGGGASADTLSGSVMGTPAYMPPEQALGKTSTLTTAVDVYSLGATLYETLTGRPPFEADSVPDILRKVVEQEPPSPRSINPALDRDLETVCLKCLEKDPARRYGSAEALADELDRWLEGRPIEARRASVRERGAKWVRRRPGLSALLALLLLMFGSLLAGGVAFAWQLQRSNVALREQTDRAETSAYIAEINLARRAVDVGDIAGALDQLDELRPDGPSSRDRRGFEWHYLQRLCGYEHLGSRDCGAPVQSVAYRPDGRRFAAGLGVGDNRGFENTPGEVVVWDDETGEVVLRFKAHDGPVFDLAYGPDGLSIATAGADRVARRWDAETGALLGEYGSFRQACNGVAISPDGRKLVVTSGDRYPLYGHGPGFEQPGEVAVWDLVADRPLWRKVDPTGGDRAVIFTPDGLRVISGGFTWLMDREAETGALVKQYPNWGAQSLSISPRGDRIAATSVDGGMGVVLTMQSGRSLFRLGTISNNEQNRYGWLSDLAFAPPLGDQLVGSFGYEPPGLPSVDRIQPRRRMVSVWNDRGRRLYQLAGNRAAVMSLAFRPDGRRLVTTDEGGEAHVWATTIAKPSSTTKTYPSAVKAVAVSPDGRRLGVATVDGAIRFDDLQGKSPTVTAPPGGPVVMGLAFSPDGRALAASGDDGSVRLIDPETGRPLRRMAAPGGVANFPGAILEG